MEELYRLSREELGKERFNREVLGIDTDISAIYAEEESLYQQAIAEESALVYMTGGEYPYFVFSITSEETEYMRELERGYLADVRGDFGPYPF